MKNISQIEHTLALKGKKRNLSWSFFYCQGNLKSIPSVQSTDSSITNENVITEGKINNYQRLFIVNSFNMSIAKRPLWLYFTDQSNKLFLNICFCIYEYKKAASHIKWMRKGLTFLKWFNQMKRKRAFKVNTFLQFLHKCSQIFVSTYIVDGIKTHRVDGVLNYTHLTFKLLLMHEDLFFLVFHIHYYSVI